MTYYPIYKRGELDEAFIDNICVLYIYIMDIFSPDIEGEEMFATIGATTILWPASNIQGMDTCLYCVIIPDMYLVI